jgi:DNA replication and repair protein RecF
LYLQEIVIKEFRNIKSVQAETKYGLNFLIGANGQGKTNFLEAIYYLAFGNSFRSADHQALLNFGNDRFVIEGFYKIRDRVNRSTVTYDREKNKKLILNEKKVSFSEQELNLILFTPDDLYLVKGSPKQRRNLLDHSLKQISKDFSIYIDNYGKLLKKRNYLLKSEQTNSKMFSALNQSFIEQGARVILARMNYVQFLDQSLTDIYHSLNGGNGNLKIKYALSFPLDHDKINVENLCNKLEEQLEQTKEAEQKRKMTLTGPHLDDLHIYAEGRLARQYCSQGQQRNIVIALKLAEIRCFAEIKGYFPLFLLDEVLAELDENKRKQLLHYLEQAPFQSFLTAVNMDYVRTIDRAEFYFINQGSLTRKE